MACTPEQLETARKSRERQRARMAEDPEYAAEVKARKSESCRKYYAANKEKWAYDPARHTSLMKSNPVYVQRKRDEAAQWNKAHRDQVLRRKKVYRETNSESIAEYMAEWELSNRDKRYAINYRRRALVATVTVGEVRRSDVWDRDDGVCGICTDPADSNDWHLDHIMPLSKGGLHTMDNVQVSHPRCNLSKGAKI